MTTDDLAGILAEHSMYSYQPYAKGYVCDCGVTIFRTPEDADADESLLGKHAAHQAAVIAAAGWVKGPELDPIRTYYRSLTPDGKLWCESRDPDEVREMSEGKGCTFERYDIYEVTEGWQPWAEPA